MLVDLKEPRLQFRINENVKAKHLEHLSFMNSPVTVLLWEGVQLYHIGEDRESGLARLLDILLDLFDVGRTPIEGLKLFPEGSESPFGTIVGFKNVLDIDLAHKLV